MKSMNKPVVLTMAALFLVGGAALAEDTAMPLQTSGKTLSETTNSGDTSSNMGSTNSDMGGVKPSGANAGTATNEKGMADHRMANKGANYEGTMKAIPHATISFDKGSAMLSETARASLRDLVKDARASGTIDQVTVAAWSDKALPMGKRDLTEADRDLASKRADAISSVLKTELEVGDVDTYNMAERANWLARTFGTRQAELKSVFAKKGADTPVTNAEFQVIKNEGGPSEAVVVVEKEMR
jgi:hypothetical protein